MYRGTKFIFIYLFLNDKCVRIMHSFWLWAFWKQKSRVVYLSIRSDDPKTLLCLPSKLISFLSNPWWSKSQRWNKSVICFGEGFASLLSLLSGLSELVALLHREIFFPGFDAFISYLVCRMSVLSLWSNEGSRIGLCRDDLCAVSRDVTTPGYITKLIKLRVQGGNILLLVACKLVALSLLTSITQPHWFMNCWDARINNFVVNSGSSVICIAQIGKRTDCIYF